MIQRREKRSFSRTHARPILLSLVAAVLVAGCNPVTIRGRVVDVEGEGLPGVAVTVEGTPYQGLTDALGEYSVPFEPGDVILSFAKTGFTHGRLELKAAAAQPVTATTVQLWQLPPNKGVYLFSPASYTRLALVTPERFQSKSLGTVYGVPKWSEVLTPDTQPILIAYRTSQYEVRLYRLEPAEMEVESRASKTEKISILIPVESIPVAAVAIDEPLRQLTQLRYDGELAPSVYAVHWGGLDGETQIEDGVAFLFRVAGDAPAEGEADLPPLDVQPE